MVHQPADHCRVDGVRLRKSFREVGQHFVYRLVRSGHKIKAAQARLKLSGFSGQRGFLQFQKIALCIAEHCKKRIPRFLQFQIVRIRALRLRRAVFLHTGAAFKQALAAAQNGFCRLPKLLQGVKGTFRLLLQSLFHPVTSRRRLHGFRCKVKDRRVFLRRAGNDAQRIAFVAQQLEGAD